MSEAPSRALGSAPEAAPDATPDAAPDDAHQVAPANPGPGTPKAASSQASLSTASIAGTDPGLPVIDKIVVAIHGIGSQLRSSTIRSVAQRFGDHISPPMPVMPLGYFNLGKTDQVSLSYLKAPKGNALAHIGFAEVFWADIPQRVVKAKDTLEETKAWGRTVVSRAEATYRSKVKGGQLTPADFQLGVGVVEEIVETIDVLDNLLAVAGKAGVFKFELAPLLRDFIGDVQLVTDFPNYREEIIVRFQSALAQIVKAFTGLHPHHTPEIYIVAHSEGTVISLLGLLEVLSGRVVIDPASKPNEPVLVDTRWIKHVRGYMTIGSPIDKHIALWPDLWESATDRKARDDATGVVAAPGVWQGLALESQLDSVSGEVVFKATDASQAPQLKLAQQIKWRNYYDLGDPIGFQLDTARALLDKYCCHAFEFEPKHDMGFSRYWLPGKAHNDYWQDEKVFGHFIDDVVLPKAAKPAPPKGSWWVDIFSTAIPYVITLVLHLAAVYVLYRAVLPAAPGPSIDLVGPPVSQLEPFLNVLVLSVLLLAITVAARLPRLVKPNGFRWHLVALMAFLIGALPSAFALPEGVISFLGGYIVKALSRFELDRDWTGHAALLGTAFVIASSGWWMSRKPTYGRKVLLSVGGGVIGLVVLSRLVDGSVVAPVWPVLLAGLAFLYLWWLGILLFDLAFIWHRYIRCSVAIDTLAHWCRECDAVPRSMFGLGKPR